MHVGKNPGVRWKRRMTGVWILQKRLQRISGNGVLPWKRHCPRVRCWHHSIPAVGIHPDTGFGNEVG